MLLPCIQLSLTLSVVDTYPSEAKVMAHQKKVTASTVNYEHVIVWQWCSQGQTLNPQGQGQGLDLRGQGHRSRVKDKAFKHIASAEIKIGGTSDNLIG